MTAGYKPLAERLAEDDKLTRLTVAVLASSRMPDILERGIDDHVWLEPVECKAPVRPALWYSSLYGWEFV